MSKQLLAAVIVVFITCQVWALQPNKITAAEAAGHIGQTATVCGVVASATHATSSRGRPTFLNLDKPYPSHIFTAVIWENNRPKFSYAPESLNGKSVCVSGRIEQYKGKAQIEVRDPVQIQMD